MMEKMKKAQSKFMSENQTLFEETPSGNEKKNRLESTCSMDMGRFINSRFGINFIGFQSLDLLYSVSHLMRVLGLVNSKVSFSTVDAILFSHFEIWQKWPGT